MVNISIYLTIFPESFKSNEITANHCKEMGKVLAEIHSIDKSMKMKLFMKCLLIGISILQK